MYIYILGKMRNLSKLILLRPRLKEFIFGEVTRCVGEGVPYGDYPASEDKFMSICFSEWNRKFEWMAAEITGVNFEEQIWVDRITSGNNIESHDEVGDESSVFETLQSENIINCFRP